MRTSRTFAIAVAVGAMGAGAIRAGEVCNHYCPLPSFNVNVYNITIAGNVINQLNLNAAATDPGTNPFVKVGGTSTVTAALDAHGNTVVTFTGSKPINSSDQFNYGPPGALTNFEPHFGVDGTLNGGALLPIISHGWMNSNTGQSMALPALSFLTAPPASGATDVDYVVFFANVTDPGPTVGQWFEEPFDGSKSPSLTLTNYTAGNDTLSDAGYFISESYIPLDQLNFGSNSPPGYPGSPFIPLPSLDGLTLPGGDGIGGAGGSISINVSGVPEPSGFVSLAIGLLIISRYIGRRRSSARRAQRGGDAGRVKAEGAGPLHGRSPD